MLWYCLDAGTQVAENNKKKRVSYLAETRVKWIRARKQTSATHKSNLCQLRLEHVVEMQTIQSRFPVAEYLQYVGVFG